MRDVCRVALSSVENHSFRVCLVETSDFQHVREQLQQVTPKAGHDLYHFTFTSRQRFNPEKLQWELLGNDRCDPAAILEFVRELGPKGGVVVLEDLVQYVREDTDGELATVLPSYCIRQRWGLCLVRSRSPCSATL